MGTLEDKIEHTEIKHMIAESERFHKTLEGKVNEIPPESSSRKQRSGKLEKSSWKFFQNRFPEREAEKMVERKLSIYGTVYRTEE